MKQTIAMTIWLIVGALLPLTASAQTTYPLTCKGGNQPLEIRGSDVAYLFKPGKVATNSQAAHLNPGECAFWDRGMRVDEPNALCTPTSQFALKLWFDGDTTINPYTGPYYPAVWDVEFIPGKTWPTATAIVDLMRYGPHYWTFYVYNDRHGCLRY